MFTRAVCIDLEISDIYRDDFLINISIKHQVFKSIQGYSLNMEIFLYSINILEYLQDEYN